MAPLGREHRTDISRALLSRGRFFSFFRSAFLPRTLGVLMAVGGLAWLTDLSIPLTDHLSPYKRDLRIHRRRIAHALAPGRRAETVNNGMRRLTLARKLRPIDGSRDAMISTG